ncbi:MAG: hypothetical protein K8I30_22085, partial [Anaerolineae bacterium]|nr:hypothetical protein [Anaerolineae bacterium]
VEALRTEIAAVQEQVKRLIAKQAAAPESVVNLYDEQITGLAAQLTTLRGEWVRVQQATSEKDTRAAERAFEELKTYDNLEAFWQENPTTINRLLYRLMGKQRLVVKDHEVIGTSER